MAYTLYYYLNGKLNLMHSNSWEEIFSMYIIYREYNASIRDNEYGSEFIDGQWIREDNLLGWAGGKA